MVFENANPTLQHRLFVYVVLFPLLETNMETRIQARATFSGLRLRVSRACANVWSVPPYFSVLPPDATLVSREVSAAQKRSSCNASYDRDDTY